MRRRWAWPVLALLAFFIGLASPAFAQKRVALVIGNSAYKFVPALPNTRNDAADIAKALRRLDFDVAQVFDASGEEMRSALVAFGRKARDADIAIVYYAGHGMEIGRENWLIPVNAELRSDRDVESEAIALRAAMSQASNASKLGLVILDACRNNPFAAKMARTTMTRAVDRGLARVEPTTNVLVAYASRDGTTASDGTGRNSPYTAALLKYIETPGMEIRFLFANVRDEVMRVTQQDQQPFEYGSLSADQIFLKGAPAVSNVPSVIASPPPLSTASDEAAWRFLSRTTDAVALRQFIAEFPASPRAGEARTLLAALERDSRPAPALPVPALPAPAMPIPAKPVEVAPKPSLTPRPAASGGTIKVGVLHSLSGAMAVSETTLKDVVLELIDDQNKRGGVLGRKLEAVVVDPASNWPLFAEKARELIQKNKVDVVFGCWTSVSRKSVLPVFKELNSILFYPVQYEGEESERNVFYTGATPNQQAIPAVDYLMSKDGGEVKRWVLAGTDFVYPRTTNKILESYLKSKGVKQEDIAINYTPFGHSDWQSIVSDIRKFGTAGKQTAVISTINGDANIPFYKELGNQGIKTTAIPVMALSIGEGELAGLDTRPFVGQLAAASYFQSIKTPANAAFAKDWQSFTKNPKRVVNDPMEAHYIGFNMWVKAVEKAGTTATDSVIAALPGTTVPNLTGGTATMLPNHHITKPLFVGEIRPDGQFDVVWKTKGAVAAEAWSRQLDGSRDLIGDWVDKKCGNYNTRTNRCGGPT